MSDRHPLVVKLKSGEYNGVDLMQAWLLIESQQKELAEQKELAKHHQSRRLQADAERSGMRKELAALRVVLAQARKAADAAGTYTLWSCGEMSARRQVGRLKEAIKEFDALQGEGDE